MSKSALLAEIKRAVEAKKTEASQRLAVVRILAGAGHKRQPSVRQGSDGHGTVRFYVWEDSPAGDVVLVTGPSVVGEVYTAAELYRMPAGEGFVVYAADADLRDKVRADIARAQESSPRASKPRAAKPKGERKPRAPKAAPAPKQRYASVQVMPRVPSPRGTGNYPAFTPEQAATSRRRGEARARSVPGRYSGFEAGTRSPSPRGTGNYPRMPAPARASASAAGMSAHDEAMMQQLMQMMRGLL